MSAILLATDFVGHSEYENFQGVETDIVVINKEHIDTVATVTSGGTITDLKLLTGKKGWLISGVKATNKASSSTVSNQYGSDRFKNSFEIIVPFQGTNAEAINAINVSKSGFVIVYKSKTKEPLDVNSFKVLGFTSGLFSTVTYNSSELGGGASIVFASIDGSEEPYICRFLKMGSTGTEYATTLTAFNAKFESV